MAARLKYVVERFENGYLLEIHVTNQLSKQFCFPDLEAVREHVHEDLRLLALGEEERAQKETCQGQDEEGGICCELTKTKA